MTHTKTTLYLESGEYQRLQRLARSRGESAASLIREAIAEYTARHAAAKQPKSLGLGRSGSGDLSERDEELLGDMGRDT